MSVVLLCSIAASDDSNLVIESPIGAIQTIKVSRGVVKIGRDVGLVELIARSGEPKRLNEDPSEMVEIKGDYYLMRRKVTVDQFVAFLNKSSSSSKECITPSFRVQTDFSNGKYVVKLGIEDEPAAFVSVAGAESFAKFLTETTSYRFRLPTEAELMLASIGNDSTRPQGFKFDRSKKARSGYPLSRWDNGFEAFLSPVGEWTLDTNQQKDRLLKRCVNSLYEREFYPAQSNEPSQIYGIRLLIEEKP